MNKVERLWMRFVGEDDQLAAYSVGVRSARMLWSRAEL